APHGIELCFVAGNDPLMDRVADLCFERLHEPFGVERLDDWDKLDSNSTHLVALDGETLVGYARLIAEDDWGRIRQVVVRPGWERRGIASAIVAELVRRSAADGRPQVFLNARLTATRLYEKLGFVRVGDEFETGRTHVAHVRMERVAG
ncbi:MAG: GNAT family N-acetyltransferase, partial [Actinomycetota bacterium]|nr:GNAT family N-acetyltransferase [Actinomycetota bacterium]